MIHDTKKNPKKSYLKQIFTYSTSCQYIFVGRDTAGKKFTIIFSWRDHNKISDTLCSWPIFLEETRADCDL